MSDTDGATTESRLRAIAATYGTALLAFGLGIVLAIAIANGYYLAAGELGPLATLGISLLALQGIAFPVTAYAYLRRRGLDWSFVPVRVPSLREAGWAVGIFVAAFVGIIVVGVVLQTLDVQTASNEAATTAFENPEIIPLLIPLQFLLVGPGEELLFRGIIQGTLREHFGAWGAIFLASLAFAPAHILALTGGLTAVVTSIGVLFVPSLLFGYAYERTQNLVVPALAHGLYNATLFGFIYVAVTYGPETTSVLGM